MKKPQRGERGQFLVFAALIMVSLLAILGLTVDAGRLYFSWTGLSRALDAACAATLRKATTLSDEEIVELAQDVTEYNLQQQGVDPGKLLFEAEVRRRPEHASMIKIFLNGTLQNIENILVRFIPGLKLSDVHASVQCPICYDTTAAPFTLASITMYEAGLECQRACNDGQFRLPDVNTCCNYAYATANFGQPIQCICARQAWLDILTDNCDPDANAPQPLDPDNPGIDNVIWIDRTVENMAQAACVQECTDRGFLRGDFVCNEGCREETGTVCCRCHCSNEAIC